MNNSGSDQPTNFRLCMDAAIDISPLCLAVIPWGILTGAIAIQIGLSPIQAQMMSLLVFAGAAQLSGMSLMASGASLPAILGSTFVISSRHLLYSIVFRQHVLALPLPWRITIGFFLTDEMFAVSELHTQKTGEFSPLYALASGVTFFAIWNIVTLVGIVIGDSFSNLDELGLDFAIAATFIAMTFDQIRRTPVALAMLISGVSAVLLKPWLSDSYIIVASLIGMLSAFVAEEIE